MTVNLSCSSAVMTVPCPANVAEQILHDSPYFAVQQLRCCFDQGVLTIAGRVPTFYLKQLAVLAVQKVAGVQQIRDSIEVSLWRK